MNVLRWTVACVIIVVSSTWAQEKGLPVELRKSGGAPELSMASLAPQFVAKRFAALEDSADPPQPWLDEPGDGSIWARGRN
jgi:hypothetical protein